LIIGEKELRIENVEFRIGVQCTPYNCTMQRCHFRNTKLVDCDVTGMTIDGVPVTDMIKAYQEINSISNELPALEGEKLTKPEDFWSGVKRE